MKVFTNNDIVIVHSGDTFQLPIELNIGSTYYPELYELQENDKVLLSVCEPNQDFSHALIRKIATIKDFDDGFVTFNFYFEDTAKVLPGIYYYEVKLARAADVPSEYDLTTIVPKRKFAILE